jgi:hypothetical protein
VNNFTASSRVRGSACSSGTALQGRYESLRFYLHPMARSVQFAQWRVPTIQEYNIEGPVVHLFPVASGNMLEGFPQRNARSAQLDHSFIGVTTGYRFSIPLLNIKYRGSREVTFIRPIHHTMKQYRKRAARFHRHTGVWLDPIHTIHLYDVLETGPFPEHSTIVVWITCPYTRWGMGSTFPSLSDGTRNRFNGTATQPIYGNCS